MDVNKLIDHKVINELATKIHVQTVLAGWWPDDSDLLTKAQLIITEIAEATEGARKDLMDDHLTHRKMEEVELADTLIRTLDLGAFAALKYKGSTIATDIEDEVIANLDHPAGLHFIISAFAVAFGTLFTKTTGEHYENNDEAYSNLIDAIMVVSNIRQYDLLTTVDEKLIYNSQRADHKLEAREAEGGKKF